MSRRDRPGVDGGGTEVPRSSGASAPNGGRGRERNTVTAEVLDVLRGFARDSGIDEQIGAITADTRLEADLGLDSLGRSELIARLERRLARRLPDEALLAATPRDLAALAGAKGVLPAVGQTAAPAGPRAGEGAPDVRPRGGAVAAPSGADTLPAVLAWHVQRHPDRTHILCYGAEEHPRPISYLALAQGAAAVAGGLRKRGVASGGAVALMLPTGADYFFCFFGVLLAGAIPVPIYPPARPEQLEDHLRRHAAMLGNAGAVLLITVPAALTPGRLLRALVPTLTGVLTPEGLADTHDDMPPIPVEAGDIALLQYTSGSTGSPKGVVLTHADLLANIRAMGEAVAVRADDCFVSWLPLYHDMGLIGAWLGSLYFGVPLVSLSPLAFLARPVRWLRAIHDHRGTLSAAPNFAYELCLKRVRDEELQGLDLGCWRRALNGAEPVSAETLRRFAERFAHCGFPADALAPVYGLAEAAVGLTFPPATRGPRVDCIDRERFASSGEALPVSCDDTQAMPVVSCGRPLRGYRLRIEDADGRPLPERHEGRLYFRGPSATSGYYRNPEATARLIRDGWRDTGDRGYLAGGELHLTGRVKDMIIRGGRNLYPYEVEEAVGELPGVRKGCVVAFAAGDPARGSERLVLVAETRERDPDRRAALALRIRERATDVLGLPPDEVVLAPPRSVPKTSSGKLRRGAARERWEAGRLASGPPAPLWQLLRLGAAGAVTTTLRVLARLPGRLYAAYAWLLFALIAPWAWIGIVAAPTLRGRWRVARAGVGLLRRLAFVPLSVRGREHMPPPGEPFVLACNHQSYLDVAALVLAVDRPVAFVAKQGLARNPFVRLALERVGTLFVDRFDLLRGAAEAERFAVVLGRGQPLGFFPEGTFRDRPGLLPFRMGAFLAATGAGVPLLPVALRGTRGLMRGTTFFPRWGRAEVRIGEPLLPGGDDWQAAVRLRDRARAFIADHCD
jgi:1-acyl-sn-glycerol-3-phosphate acyltransferase